MKTLTRFLNLMLGCLLLLPATNALSHCMCERAEPRVGSTVSVTPSAVKIWFDDDLSSKGSNISVKNARGQIVDKNDAHLDSEDPNLLKVSVETLAPGTYSVHWTAVSTDGHPTEGDYQFTLK